MNVYYKCVTCRKNDVCALYLASSMEKWEATFRDCNQTSEELIKYYRDEIGGRVIPPFMLRKLKIKEVVN